ncbi:MAG: tyrosine-type recombinase/integrase [Kiritimatiellaeota bacterium]|nr:tyrosine-type recombinase/integrase [Kiritimatiellota bacterium]
MKTRHGHLFKRNGMYYVQWRIKGKLFMRSTRTHDRKEAEQERARIMEPFIKGNEVTVLQNISARIEGRTAEIARYEETVNPPLTITAAWDHYLQNPNRPDSGPLTQREYESHYDQFLAWLNETHPEAVAMRNVTKEIAAEYAGHLVKRGLSANRFNKHICFLDLFFRVCRDKAKLTENPWDRNFITRKNKPAQGRRELTIDELRRVCSTATGEMQILFALGIYTGLREVDLRRERIMRIPNKTARRKPNPVIIPIHPTLKGILSEIPTVDRSEYIIPKTAALYQKGPYCITELVRAHFEACGIKPHKPGTGQGTEKRAVVEVGFHSMRHSFVSMCREANAPLSVVEAIVGHSNPAMTRHYTHVSELAAASAVNSLPAVMGDMSLPALPPAKMIDAAPVCALADKLNGKNWRTVKKELRKLAN